ncbi:DUF1127 domain-containing protein [Inquilinus sp.]|jgi:uncharacterized protein YjiS (DUF1127 family)|uniref:DUF1127 domain-containing protein n=1 Tax=Inquilinus sp. TaxID=1932117 RepID=UPI003784222C
MSIPVVQLITLPRSAISFPPRRRSPLQRLAARVAGLWRRMAEHTRLRRDHRHLEQMTDHELRDIGLRRVGARHFVLISDAEGG